jgi:hypothetical protein
MDEKLKEKRKDYYGSKYSQHVFNTGNVPQIQQEEEDKRLDDISTQQFWKDMDRNNAYGKKHTLRKIQILFIIARKQK